MALTKKGQARLEQIGEKAMYLFNEKGYVNTSMDEIARACSCDVANLYNYFPGKEHILFNVVKAMISTAGEVSAEIIGLDSLSPVEKIKAIVFKQMYNRVQLGFTDLYTRFKADLDPAHAREIVALRDRYEQQLRDLIQEGIESGEFKKVDVKIAGITIASFIERIVLWYSPREELSLEEITDHFCDLLFEGIGLEKDGHAGKTGRSVPRTVDINRKIKSIKGGLCTDI